MEHDAGVMLLELIATLCTGVFAGAALYVNLVEHPARLETGTALALRQWRPSYRRATVMQASLAVAGLLAAVGAWLQGRGAPVLIAGLLLGSVVPFTLIVIFPTNSNCPTLGSTRPRHVQRPSSARGTASMRYVARRRWLPLSCSSSISVGCCDTAKRAANMRLKLPVARE